MVSKAVRRNWNKASREKAVENNANTYIGICPHHGKTLYRTKTYQCMKCCSERNKKKFDISTDWLNKNFFSKGCFYCHMKKPVVVMQLEHKIASGITSATAVSKKGKLYRISSTAYLKSGNITSIRERIRKDGIVPACADCNFVKSKTLDKGDIKGWKQYLKEARALAKTTNATNLSVRRQANKQRRNRQQKDGTRHSSSAVLSKVQTKVLNSKRSSGEAATR